MRTLPQTDAEALTQLLDALPIFATKLGYRDDSTPKERALADAAFKVHETWLEVRP